MEMLCLYRCNALESKLGLKTRSMKVYQEETGNVQKLYSSWAELSLVCACITLQVAAISHHGDSFMFTNSRRGRLQGAYVRVINKSQVRISGEMGFVRPSAAENQDQALQVDPGRPEVGKKRGVKI